MSPVHPHHRIDPYAPFEIVFQTAGTRQAVVLHSAYDPDGATVAFHEAWQRLAQDQVVGDVLLVHHDIDARTLLRLPLG